MATFKIGGKALVEQSGTATPSWGANAPTGTVVKTYYAEITTSGTTCRRRLA